VTALSAAQVQPGDHLPELALEITPTVIIAAALASRDFERVHHDRTHAQASGMRDIFINILATNGFVVRYVTDWAGPDAVVKQSSIRLGVPHYAGETLTLTGSVTEVTPDGEVSIAVRGRNIMGDHVSGTVTVTLGGGST
jgi:acyl dehydratase